MNMIDRYVHAVKTFLPKAQQDDITQELSENLQSQFDDREAELGRPLGEAEQTAMLQQHGHPMVVAGRYQRNQGGLVFGRQLIGTALFPFYLRVLRFTLGISFAIFVVVMVVLAVTGNPSTVGDMLQTAFYQFLIQFGVITVIFAAVDRSLPALPWNARQPPILPRMFHQGVEAQVSRLASLAQIVALVVLLGGLSSLYAHPAALLGPAAETYRLGAVWQQIALPTLVVFIISIAQATINLARPDWVRLPLAVHVATDAISLLLIGYLLHAGQWIVLANANITASTVLGSINMVVAYCLWFTLIIVLIVLVVDIRKLSRQSLSE